MQQLPDDDPLENYYESRLREDDAKPETRTSLVRRWLEWAGLADVFEPRSDIEVAEAWIPVQVKADLPDGILPLLGALRGVSGVLTYENSD